MSRTETKNGYTISSLITDKDLEEILDQEVIICCCNKRANREESNLQISVRGKLKRSKTEQNKWWIIQEGDDDSYASFYPGNVEFLSNEDSMIVIFIRVGYSVTTPPPKSEKQQQKKQGFLQRILHPIPAEPPTTEA